MTDPPFLQVKAFFLTSYAQQPWTRRSMKLSRAPVSSFVLVSMDRYCQERATQVLDDFAAAGTFLLNCEETVSGWPGSCLSLTNSSMSRHSLLRGQVKSGLLSRPNSEAAKKSARSATELNETIYRCSQRTTFGDIPVIRRKCLARWLWSENPADRAISDSGSSLLRSMCWACSTRRCST